MKISNLKVNGHFQPLGYYYDHLSFSWDTFGEYDEKIMNQLVIISDDPRFENVLEKVKIDNSWNVASLNPTFLKPRKRYFWKVLTNTEEKKYEADSWFETGKISEEWSADWISYKEKSENSVTFSKSFKIDKKIKQARLYCCGYGIYECSINEEEITDEVLLPGYHSYDLLNQYQSFDITDYLRQDNTISFITGNGWYKGRFVFEGGYENIYGDKQQLIAELVIELEDGEIIKVLSDDTWDTKTSAIIENSIYDGELQNFRVTNQNLTTTVLKSGKNLLTERSNPAILRQQELTPMKAFYDKNSKIVLDFGQIITGWVEGWVTKGREVSLRFAELMQNGEFYRDNLRTAQQKFTVLLSEEKKYIRPHFTFFGFRFVEVTGISMEEAVELKAYSIYSNMEELFHFDSGNSKLNQLVKNIKWSQRDNFLDIPTDCPQRDERMGWTGDVTVFANASCYNFESKGFYEHYLRNLALEQKKLSGSVPFFVPFPKIEPRENINPFLVTNGAAVWGDVATTLPYQLFRHFKDRALLEQTVEIMQGWVDYLYQKDLDNGAQHLWDFDRQLGDWLAMDNGNPANPVGATDPNLIASIYYYRSTTYLAECLRVLKNKKSQKYEQLSKKIREAILSTYFENDSLILTPLTQTGLSLLLRYQLYPSLSALSQLRNQLSRLLTENNNYLNTGFVGTPEITHVLAENSMTELAYTLLLNEESPSWLYEVNQGATTVWERWNSILPNGEISGTEMNSLNHYAYGAIQDFIIEKVVGLSHILYEDEYNLYTMNFKPYFEPRLPWVKGELKTPQGIVKVSWSWIDENLVEIEVDIPNNTNLIYVNSEAKEEILQPGEIKMEVKVK